MVKDVKYTPVRDDVPEQAFIPYLGSHFAGGMTVYARTAADPSAIMPLIRERMHDLDPNLPIYSMRTTEAQLANSLSNERMIASLSSVFGLLATLLAVLGLYGVMPAVQGCRFNTYMRKSSPVPYQFLYVLPKRAPKLRLSA